MHIDGQCHCGYVTYEAEIDPGDVSLCHCTDCQRLTGSPFRVTALVSKDNLRLTGNAPKTYQKRGDNGALRYQLFCLQCGSPLFTTGEGEDAKTYGIRWGSINQRAMLKPLSQYWCRSAAPWLDELTELPGVDAE